MPLGCLTHVQPQFSELRHRAPGHLYPGDTELSVHETPTLLCGSQALLETVTGNPYLRKGGGYKPGLGPALEWFDHIQRCHTVAHRIRKLPNGAAAAAAAVVVNGVRWGIRDRRNLECQNLATTQVFDYATAFEGPKAIVLSVIFSALRMHIPIVPALKHFGGGGF